MRISPLFLATASLFLGAMPLQAQQEVSLENLPKLIQIAEIAYGKGDFQTAKTAYEELIRLGGKHAPAPRNYFERIFKLALIEQELGSPETSYELLGEITKDQDLPEDLFVKAKVQRARLLSKQQEPGLAYQQIIDAMGIMPVEEWNHEDRAYTMGLVYLLNQHYSDMLAKAERLSLAGNYDQALPLYKEVWMDSLRGYFPEASILKGKELTDKIRFLMAEAAYQLKDIDMALKTLEPAVEEILQAPEYASRAELNILYLASLCYQQQQQPEKVTRMLEGYVLAAEGKAAPKQYAKALWELGVAYFQMGQDDVASKHFYELLENTQDKDLKFLTITYLARIEVRNSFFLEAKQKVDFLLSHLSLDDPLRYEAAYLSGEVAYHQGRYMDAIAAFDLAAPAKNSDQAPWFPGLLLKKARSFFQLALAEDTVASREEFYLQAEKLLGELIQTGQKAEEGAIELAGILLQHARVSSNPVYYDKVEEVLTLSSLNFSDDQLANSLLLRAEASNSYEFREKLFAQLFSDSRFSETAARRKGFLLRGMNFSQMAAEKVPAEAVPYWEKAEKALSQALSELTLKEPESFSLALKLRAEALYNLGSSRHLISALKTLRYLFKEKEQLLPHLQDPGEAYFLQGMISAQYYELDPKKPALRLAKKALGHVANNYPGHPYADQALYTLGALQFQTGDLEAAHSSFSRCLERYPRSEFRDKALFWLAETAAEQGAEKRIVRAYRTRLFDEMPSSPLAASAYLHYYDFEEYLSGSHGPREHLKKMQKLFPSSPYLIVSYYLLGLQEKKDQLSLKKEETPEQLDQAISYFQDSILAYDHFYTAHAIPAREFIYLTTIRYQAELEKAITQVLQGEERVQLAERYADAYETLLGILHAFHDDQNMVTQALLQNSHYPKVMEEAQFTLVQLYLKENKEVEARRLLSNMLEQYQSASQTKGYYLSRSLYELALLKLQTEKWEPALYYFEKSEEAATSMGLQQKLEMLMHKSHCYRGLKEYDKALASLSKVIEAEFPSPITTEAMLMKAEVYEDMGKKDLAIKTLKATAKRKGDSASRAQTKLQQEYGYQ